MIVYSGTSSASHAGNEHHQFKNLHDNAQMVGDGNLEEPEWSDETINDENVASFHEFSMVLLMLAVMIRKFYFIFT